MDKRRVDGALLSPAQCATSGVIWPGPAGSRRDVAASDFWYGLTLINDLTASVSPIMEVVADGDHAVLRERWVFRSLLASMAMRLPGPGTGRPGHVCKNCGHPSRPLVPRRVLLAHLPQQRTERRQMRALEAQGKKVV